MQGGLSQQQILSHLQCIMKMLKQKASFRQEAMTALTAHMIGIVNPNLLPSAGGWTSTVQPTSAYCEVIPVALVHSLVSSGCTARVLIFSDAEAEG